MFAHDGELLCTLQPPAISNDTREEADMSDQNSGTDGAAEVRDAEGARSRPRGETTATERREAQHLHVDVGHFDLASEAASLIAEARESATGRSSKTVVKVPHLHLTLTAARAGTRIEEHSAHAPVAFLGLVGAFQVLTGEQTFPLRPQQMVSLVPDVKHSLEATQDCAFLLTVGWSTEAAEAAEESHQRAHR
jgi:quercetin dioxygenase-like cupin family protein